MTARLKAMRADLRADLAPDKSQHAADVASDLYAGEEILAERVTLSHELEAVDDALGRVANGTYGICIDCGRAIAPERLAALPQAARCITCQRRSERMRPRA